MKTCKWTSHEEALCQSLLGVKTSLEISAEINRRFAARMTGFPHARSQNAVERKCLREGWKPSIAIEEPEADAVDSQWELINQLQDKYRKTAVVNTRGILKPRDVTTKILSLSDIHFPLAETKFLIQAIEEHKDADIVVVNGDLLEGYAFSTFEKNQAIAALDEYRTAFAFVEHLAKTFPKVVLVDGNHDIRVSRALKGAGLTKEATQILRPNLMARIANGERLDRKGNLVEKVQFDNVYYQENESWYVRIGRTLFIHPHGSATGGPGGMVKKHAIRFNTRYAPGEIDSIVCGHTHQIYKAVINNQLLIEQGCFASLMSYAWSPNAEYLTNAQNGYAVIYQDKDGNTDFNLSGPIYLGEVVPPKKSLM